MNTVLITGGSGLIGRSLGKMLTEKGFDVSILSSTHRQLPGFTTYYWDSDKKKIDESAVINAAYIIHLAGANIGDRRWTKRRKKLIAESRISSAQLLFDVVKQHNKELKAFISASAVGYYGVVTSDRIADEADPPASDFLGETCRLWEAAADKFSELGIRIVKIRTGVVLTGRGGALAKMRIPFNMGIGSVSGSGNQFLPWVHIDDLCEIYVKAITDIHMTGAYNAVAPDQKTNREFSRELAHTLHKPFWFPAIPEFVLKLVFGEMADMILKGTRISSEKISRSGFKFKFPGLKEALSDLLKH